MHFHPLLNQTLTILLLALLTSVPSWAEEEFLPPEQAFPLAAEAEGPGQVVLNWSVAPGYYLYRDKFRFRSLTEGIRTGQADIPAGDSRHDEFFGEVKILRGEVEIWLPVERAAGSGDRFKLEVSSQGCADAGFCYPPHRQTLAIALPPLPTAPAISPDLAVAPNPAATFALEPPAAPKPTSKPGTAADLAPAADKTSPSRERTGLAQSLGLNDPGDEQTLLPAEDAFRFRAEVLAPDRLRLHWTIAPGTFLYRDKLSLRLEGPSGVALGDFSWPEAERVPDAVRPDGSLGEVYLYRDAIAVEVPLLGGRAGEVDLALTASYQGCADIGVCYPPQRLRVDLKLPPLSPDSPDSPDATRTSAPAKAMTEAKAVAVATPATAAVSAPVQSEQDRIAATLASGGLMAVLGLFFGFGLLLALTPCVFPMIPILSGIIAGHGPGISTRKAFWMSLTYVLAMSLTYALAGLLAGLGGANLQAAFQDPWILTFFALVFAALALSMFGFYDLQLPSSLQSRIATFSQRQQGGHLVGVAIMGALSALIVGPCVAPPLAGALIFISQTGDAVLGFAALFAMGLGMGAPLLAIGTSAGKLLPRAGAWMESVKAVFGVALLGVAILLLERLLPPAVALLLWGGLLICSAVYMGALSHLTPDASGWRRLWKGLGLVLLVYGALMLVGAAAGGKDTLQPLRGLLPALGAAGGSQAVQFKSIKGTAGLERELAAAQAAGRPVLLDFYADWCVSCKEMERYTFSDPAVAAAMSRFVLLKADVTANDEEDQALMQGRFGIPGPPAMLFFDLQGEESRGHRVVGFMPAAEFAAHLRNLAP